MTPQQKMIICDHITLIIINVLITIKYSQTIIIFFVKIKKNVEG